MVALLSFNAITDRLASANDLRTSSVSGKSSGGTLKGSGKLHSTLRPTTMVVSRGQANQTLKRQAMRRFHADTEKIILDDFAKGIRVLLLSFRPSRLCSTFTGMGMALDRIIADVNSQFGTLLLSDPKVNSKNPAGR